MYFKDKAHGGLYGNVSGVGEVQELFWDDRATVHVEMGRKSGLFYLAGVSLGPGENSSQSPPHIDLHCCYGCGDSLDDIFRQRCTCKSSGNGAHRGYNCPPKVSIISNSETCHDQNVKKFPQTLPSFHPTCYSRDENSFAYDSTLNFVKNSSNVFNPPSQPPMYSYEFCGYDAHYSYDCSPQPVIDHLNVQQRINDPMIELRGTFQAWLQQRKGQVCQKIPLCYNDDNDEESSNPLRNIIISELPPCIAITPVVYTKDSLIIGDEHLYTIPGKFFVISSSKIDSLLDEFAGELLFLKSISPGIDEADCDSEEEIHLIEKLFYDNSSPRPPKEFISENSDAAIKSFSPSPIPVKDSDSLRDEIDLSLTLDDSMPPGIEDDDYDSEGDILILEELLSNDSHSLPENESFHFDIPSSPRPPAKPPGDDDIEPNLEILTVKVVGDISEHYVVMPRLLPTQPTLTSNEEKSPHLLSHRGLKPFQLYSESPMMIYEGNIPILDVPFLPSLTSSSMGGSGQAK
uniref:Uncharacterized protein n=1 Tax=Tanacetum cinerariifolium TaxID=118510 RepID=A0A6L2P1X7_TANCI|nr:hypothetical protein [Tanacetum cinerariifolium]